MLMVMLINDIDRMFANLFLAVQKYATVTEYTSIVLQSILACFLSPKSEVTCNA